MNIINLTDFIKIQYVEVVSIAEFASPSSILSLSCVSAGLRTVTITTEGVEVSTEDEDNLDNHEVEGDRKEKTVVKLYIVQPKSLQECSIIYDNPINTNKSLSVSIEDELTSPIAPSLLKTSPGGNIKTSPASAPPPASSSSPRLPTSSQLPGILPNISQDQLPPILPSIQDQLPAILPSMQCPDLAEAASKISL